MFISELYNKNWFINVSALKLSLSIYSLKLFKNSITISIFKIWLNFN